jgi:hypothetical protein
MVRLILLLAFYFSLSTVFGQSKFNAEVFANKIDADTGLIVRNIVLDTTYIEKQFGGRISVAANFQVSLTRENKKLKRFLYQDNGKYPVKVVFYFYNGKPFRGLVQGRFRRTDTNPEFQDSVSFNVVKGKVVQPRRNKGYSINCTWFLMWMEDLINLSGLH